MAYDETLAQRIRQRVATQSGVREKTRFGGIGFLLHGNMACGVIRDRLIVRVGPAHYGECLALPHAHAFDMTGRPMKGWITVSPAGYASDNDLEHWLNRGIGFCRTLPPKS
jgi:TfoX/Sxy family transcriptional regulator of competence genes